MDRKSADRIIVKSNQRHYKSGKVVWVKPSVQYKNRDEKQGKEYEL